MAAKRRRATAAAAVPDDDNLDVDLSTEAAAAAAMVLAVAVLKDNALPLFRHNFAVGGVCDVLELRDLYTLIHVGKTIHELVRRWIAATADIRLSRWVDTDGPKCQSENVFALLRHTTRLRRFGSSTQFNAHTDMVMPWTLLYPVVRANVSTLERFYVAPRSCTHNAWSVLLECPNLQEIFPVELMLREPRRQKDAQQTQRVDLLWFDTLSSASALGGLRALDLRNAGCTTTSLSARIGALAPHLAALTTLMCDGAPPEIWATGLASRLEDIAVSMVPGATLLNLQCILCRVINLKQVKVTRWTMATAAVTMNNDDGTAIATTVASYVQWTKDHGTMWTSHKLTAYECVGPAPGRCPYVQMPALLTLRFDPAHTIEPWWFALWMLECPLLCTCSVGTIREPGFDWITSSSQGDCPADLDPARELLCLPQTTDSMSETVGLPFLKQLEASPLVHLRDFEATSIPDGFRRMLVHCPNLTRLRSMSARKKIGDDHAHPHDCRGAGGGSGSSGSSPSTAALFRPVSYGMLALHAAGSMASMSEYSWATSTRTTTTTTTTSLDDDGEKSTDVYLATFISSRLGLLGLSSSSSSSSCLQTAELRGHRAVVCAALYALCSPALRAVRIRITEDSCQAAPPIVHEEQQHGHARLVPGALKEAEETEAAGDDALNRQQPHNQPWTTGVALEHVLDTCRNPNLRTVSISGLELRPFSCTHTHITRFVFYNWHVFANSYGTADTAALTKLDAVCTSMRSIVTAFPCLKVLVLRLPNSTALWLPHYSGCMALRLVQVLEACRIPTTTTAAVLLLSCLQQLVISAIVLGSVDKQTKVHLLTRLADLCPRLTRITVTDHYNAGDGTRMPVPVTDASFDIVLQEGTATARSVCVVYSSSNAAALPSV